MMEAYYSRWQRDVVEMQIVQNYFCSWVAELTSLFVNSVTEKGHRVGVDKKLGRFYTTINFQLR